MPISAVRRVQCGSAGISAFPEVQGTPTYCRTGRWRRTGHSPSAARPQERELLWRPAVSSGSRRCPPRRLDAPSCWDGSLLLAPRRCGPVEDQPETIRRPAFEGFLVLVSPSSPAHLRRTHGLLPRIPGALRAVRAQCRGNPVFSTLLAHLDAEGFKFSVPRQETRGLGFTAPPPGVIHPALRGSKSAN